MTALCSGQSGTSDALRMLAHGSPLGRTLEALAAIATSIRDGIGCAILLVDDDRLLVAAHHAVNDSDQRLLSRLCRLPVNECLSALRSHKNSEVRTLVTAGAELIGAIVVFSSPNTSPGGKLTSQLDEVCSIITLAVESRHLADELNFRAHHDALTQLWNRVWLEDEITRILDDSRNIGFSTGLIHIGLDSFRVINELLGSQMGNDLLRLVAGRLSKRLQPTWLLARCGGDEFLLLLPDLVSSAQVDDIAAELLDLFQQPFELDDHELLIRASIGTSFASPGECGPDDLLNRAEIALRQAKRSARGRIAAFSPFMISTPPERLEMERHLRFALQKREFELYYQPQLHLPTGRLFGVEALLRWRHPSLGFISPASFIPIAEQIGIIEDIGDWVLGEAIHQLERWRRLGLVSLRMAVNVSALQFSRRDFASAVTRHLRRADIDPKDLELEITESAVMLDLGHAARQLNLLSALGVSIALDDFGTGHSSLAYLQQLPIQRLKIDRMFVKDISSETDRHPLLAGIIQLGFALGCAVIAEGIETAEQAAALANLHCHEVQGFYFSKPLSADDLYLWAQQRIAA